MLHGELPAEASFYVNELHHKRLIGHGGATIQRVMKKYAVYVKFLGSTEAMQQTRMDQTGILPKTLISKLPNVLIRTPAKNAAALRGAQQEILEMAEEEPAELCNRNLWLSRKALLAMTEEEQRHLSGLIASFADAADFKFSGVVDELMMTHICMEISGYSGAMNKFYESILDGSSKVAELFQKLQETTSDYPRRDSLAGPPSPLDDSPGGKSTAGSSTSSQWTWSGDSPGLFDLFPRRLLPPSPLISTKGNLDSPILMMSEGSGLPSPKLGPEFDPAVGSPRSSTMRKLGAWNDRFPKTPIWDTLLVGDECDDTDVAADLNCGMNWKMDLVQNYRRRASAVFRS
jgi:hypothetical protein